MATVTTWAGADPLPDAPPNKASVKAKDEHRALSYSMERVLEELGDLRDSPDNEDAVHDLRVSIRRCRSIASVMEEVDPNAAWAEMRRAAKKLFHGLGALRDAQVMKAWLRKLAPEDDLIAAQLLAADSEREPELRNDALRAARKFAGKNWHRLERVLRRRARLVPIGGLAAECLTLERFAAAKEMHARAMRTEQSNPWHALRKSMKEFRYTVENLLPEHHARWRGDLKRVQDLLGDVHDLDVLAAAIESVEVPEGEGEVAAEAKSVYGESAQAPAASVEDSRRAWLQTLARERSHRIAAYRQLMLGSAGLWSAWRHALPHGPRQQDAAMARLRATARAADAHPRRTARTARLAKALFRCLRRAKASTLFADANARQLLAAAASLHNVRAESSRKSPHSGSPQKSAYKFLRGLTPPPGFANADWAILLLTVRYYRGAEPREKNSAFAKLSAEQQSTVRALAGVLRLAHALRKSGVENARLFRAENTAEAVILRIPGLPDSVEVATRLAAAKHLLEIYLAKPLVLRSIPEPTRMPTPASADAPQHYAAASD
jgi:CHAD domain-containing protein